MKHNKLMRSKDGSALTTGTFEIADDDFSETDARQFKASSEFYDRRSQIWSKLRRGDFWIALGLYLILSGVAFVVL